MEKHFLMTSSPHMHSRETTSSIMLDVIIALMPAFIGAAIFFGFRAILVVLTCVLSSVLCEWIWEKCTKKTVTVGDLSAVVTGMLLGFNLPPTVPYWMCVVGSAFAIIIVKQFFGGIGQNFMNPALSARAFLLISYPSAMTRFVDAFSKLGIGSAADAVTSATPLGLLHAAEAVSSASQHTIAPLPSYLELFVGNIGGCIGETSAMLLLIGGIYLVIRRVINPEVPVAFIGTVAILSFLLGQDPLYQILSGGVFLGAIFMATDYATNPMTVGGRILFAVGCGALTVVIRTFGGYPEGVSFAILIMNMLTPMIDRYIKPRVYGEVKKHAES